MKVRKIVGTLVPLFSLYSTESETSTFETGGLFLDWIVKTKQSAWHLLPLHQTQLEKGSATKHVPSPYKGYGIGLDPKYLSEKAKNLTPTKNELNNFIQDAKDWLPDYALFCALRDHFGTDDWSTWDENFKKRDFNTLEIAKKKFEKQIEQYTRQQWQCYKSYSELRKKAKEKQIILIGDIPYYLSLQSPLVWTHQKAFQIDKDSKLSRVSGVLAGPKAHFGRQLWGHPLYRWNSPKHNEEIINLWKIRLKFLSKLFDMIRLDHANGFFYYGSLDPLDAANDTLQKGPGFSAFEETVRYSRSVGLTPYAEDSSVKLKGLREALTKLDVWGIRILRYAVNEKRNELIETYAYIKSYPENTVAYTSLHDTEPLMGYLSLLNASQKKTLTETAGIKLSNDEKELALRLRQAVINSKARIVVIPIQDWLLTKDRINIPGTERQVNDPNWRYRLALPVEQIPIPSHT
ncbi:MAG: hypothetical protein A2171_02885 [Candidatus Levybacteria bacterium RBG_13_35_9]|nr:MAG: hypothetical protein A2171_02885 [Candidatus Levybacteria bacterium RBG_13_35_9]